jgi:hypothetical protein
VSADIGHDLGSVVSALLDTFKPVGVGIWLDSYNRKLGGRPLDLIKAGEASRVLDEATRLAGGPTHHEGRVVAKVTGAQVAAAKLKLKIDARLGRESSPAVVAIANAMRGKQ